jgi:hypothetical protein
MPRGIFKNPKERNEKISKACRGIKRSNETKRKISQSLKGNKRGVGSKHTNEWKERLREKMKGNQFAKGYKNVLGKHWKVKGIPYWKGKTKELSPRWIKDRTKLKKDNERNDPTYQEWRLNVWKRDNFKCKINNEDCNGKIIAHHILSWRKYPELRYNINNGITLCQAHHPRKRAKEKRLIPMFQELVLVSKELI